MLGLLACRQGEQEGSGAGLCPPLGSLIETRSGRDSKSWRAEAWDEGIAGREEVKPVLSFPDVSPQPLLFAACDHKLCARDLKMLCKHSEAERAACEWWQ